MSLTAREKTLACLVLAVLLYLVCRISLGRFDTHVRELGERLSGLSAEKGQAEAILKIPEPIVVPSAGDASKVTLRLLADLTATGVSESVRVTNVERSSPGTFRVTVEGKFADTMRFLSFLERRDGRFRVTGGEIARADAATNQLLSGSATRAPKTVTLRSLAGLGLPGADAAPVAPPPKPTTDAPRTVRASFSVAVKGGA